MTDRRSSGASTDAEQPTDTANGIQLAERDPRDDRQAPPRIQRFFVVAVMLVALVGLGLLAWAFVIHAMEGRPTDIVADDDDWAWGIAGAVLLIIGGTALVIRPERGTSRQQIATAGIWSVALLAGLSGLWWFIDSSTRMEDWQGTPVQSQAEVAAYLDAHPPLPPIAGDDAGDSEVLLVPTGVMLQSVEFLSGSNVRVSGYVWQKYPVDHPDSVVRGFVLPDAVVEAYRADEAYRLDDGTTETIGWYFAATLRESFDYARYPFDRPNVSLRLWAKDFSHDIQLVPDFDAYFDLSPRSMPGIEGTFVYGNWNPVYSGFSFDLGYYNADYGVPGDESSTVGDPEVVFNLVMKRDPLGPGLDFVAYSMTVALLTFGLQVLTHGNPDIRGRFGISTAGVLGSVSVLLFGVISKQGGLRTALDTQQITYLEALPTLLYIMLLLTALNAILVCAPFSFKVLEYRDNLLPELLFWPILFSLLFVITLVVFYA